jgi:hypothetical protein
LSQPHRSVIVIGAQFQTPQLVGLSSRFFQWVTTNPNKNFPRLKHYVKCLIRFRLTLTAMRPPTLGRFRQSKAHSHDFRFPQSRVRDCAPTNQRHGVKPIPLRFGFGGARLREAAAERGQWAKRIKP